MSNREVRDNRSPLTPMSPEELEAMREAQLSRRRFLTRSGGIAAVAVGTGAGAGVVADSALLQDDVPEGPPYEYEFTGVPDTPTEPPPEEFQVFTEQEAALVEALTARIMPGTPDDPGAREAGVVYYIDRLLSSNSGIHEATYTQGPYARTYEGDSPPAEDDENTIWVQADEIHRYGYQAPISPLQTYQIAIPLVQEHAQQKFGSGVAELSEEDQDQIIWDLLDEEMEGWDQFSPIAFFLTLRRHTSEGMFSDPGYGGNRDLAGWRLVGFPGAQREYSPEEVITEADPREPQAMRHMPVFNPGRTSHDDHHNVVQPVREGVDEGSDQIGTPAAE